MRKPYRPKPEPQGTSRYTVSDVAAMLQSSKGRVRNVSSKDLRTYNGVVYDSKAEALYAFDLDRQKAAGLIADWVRQVAFPLEVNGVLVCRLVVDFVVYVGQDYELHEVKGWQTPEYKLKYKLFKALYPGVPYKLIKV